MSANPLVTDINRSPTDISGLATDIHRGPTDIHRQPTDTNHRELMLPDRPAIYNNRRTPPASRTASVKGMNSFRLAAIHRPSRPLR
jgi:hypothetical protein